MFKAGIKKEIKLFTRGFRLWGLIILVMGLALTYPAMYKMIEVMGDALTDMSSLGGEAASAADSVSGMMGSLTALYGADSIGQVGFYTGVAALVGIGMLITMLLFMVTAGGEQKKRSVIIPDCAGLTPVGYVMPKFAIYPILTVVIMFLGTLFAGLVTNAMFGNVVSMNDMLFSGACAAGYGLFEITAYFMVGLCMGRPGIAVVIVYLGSELVSLLLTAFRIDRFNPFVLYNMVGSPYEQIDDTNNFVLSLIVSVILSVIFCLITLMVAGLRKIDNSVGDANL
ncbi:MAG: ABC transporter permease [Eubacterium sp.]|nr:ABC transporter permease [Eubacterium sp.]